MGEDAVIRKVDCVELVVPDLDEGIAFYSKLGLRVLWRRETQVGLGMPETDAEIVLQTERPDPEVDLLVDSAESGAKRFAEAGGRIVEGPFDIEMGRAAVVEDPWANRLVLVDMTKAL